ncbi:hypothetical protein J5226_09965 [Lysobacter sp. K5869]|uniref:hypothetical protein n=1 Tax=Lysobacter sp. K5869 TaxID=2820808 RepID=UPI001C06370C|nr:hypothetical protein [Lysobacter sp. K5869]QWP78689.1 hypothetical protein J5226_09965 [Lysobacter sp. K5869]
MAPRSPTTALPIVNVLASALLAAVALFSTAPVSCEQPSHIGLIHPVHLFFDRVGARLERSYPQLMQWSPALWVLPHRIDCRCAPPAQTPAPAAASHGPPSPHRALIALR